MSWAVRLGLLLLPIIYVSFLIWQEVRFRQHFAGPPPVIAMATPTPPVLHSLDATAVASVLGLLPEIEQQASSQSLKLQASFVTSMGLSKALISSAQGQRLYLVGERLPGGGTLRRVQTDHVVLWNKGREERLLLKPAGNHVLQRLGPGTQASVPANSTRYLRPIAGSQSDQIDE